MTSSYDSWLEGQQSAGGAPGSMASPYGLWLAAGGGTPDYDRQRYRDLLHEHGYTLRPGDDGYDEAPRNLPCGWPGKRVSEG